MRRIVIVIELPDDKPDDITTEELACAGLDVMTDWLDQAKVSYEGHASGDGIAELRRYGGLYA